MLIIEVKYHAETILARGGKKGLLVIILAPDNLSRMKQADPVALATQTYPHLRNYVLSEIEVIICDEDPETLHQFTGAPDRLIKHLLRGYRELPGDGEPPVPFVRPS